jgi:nitroreductase
VKRHTVWSAITLANRAPSVHNTQPWRWRVAGESIHLTADHTRRLRATDLDGRDLLLSCGAALHHLQVALAALGWRTEVRHVPDPNHLATVTASPNPPSTEDTALADAITRRRTDRRRFSSRPVPGAHLELMVERAAKTGALLVPVTEGHARRLLTRAMDLAACLQPDDLAYDTELATWSGRGPGAPDGVLTASTPPFPRTHGDTTMRAFVPGTLTDTDHDEPDSGQLLVLATPTDDPVSVLRAGEAASAALLIATSLGLATCPLSQPLEVPGTRALIRDEVLDGAARPHLILRTGWAPIAATPPPRSPRRATGDTIDWVTLPGLS